VDANAAALVERNEAEFLLSLGRAGGGEEREDAGVHWSIGGSPIGYHNCVIRANLDADEADGVIVASQEAMRRHGVPGSWHVWPSMCPNDLVERLKAHGFDSGPEPGMAADLSSVPDAASPDGFVVERVRDASDLARYEAVLASGFGEGPPEARWTCEMYARIGLGDNVPWRHFVGALGGISVACGSLFFTGDAAGLYFMCTSPDHRGRGLGTAMTRAVMVAAREEGFSTAVLGSSPMGQRIYERLGFREVCNVIVCEWDPARDTGG
jgi:GNAT superfamily N-acetyltransferase